MEWIKAPIDFILHIDQHLAALTQSYGVWIYAILFAIVFCETGLVVMPLLPGDSLLFAAGAICALGSMNVWALAGLLIVAAILGDTVNYHVGKAIGPKVLADPNARWLNRKHLLRTQAFFEKYGGRAIIFARFVPIVRTFAPFVAGAGTMEYKRFLAFNVIGALAWVGIFLPAGYFFGNHPLIRKNFTYVIFAIIFLSVLPGIIELIKSRRAPSA
jgi:membrane-associated protein